MKWQIHKPDGEEHYGLAIAERSLVAAGHTLDGDPGDPIATTMPWVELASQLAGTDMRGASTVVFGGLGATSNPAAAMAAGATHVWCGDGDDWRGDIDSEHVAAEGRPPAKRCVCPTIVPRAFMSRLGQGQAGDAKPRAEWGTRQWSFSDTAREARSNQFNALQWLEISRGCKRKCNFCLYGWIMPYREAALSDIEACLWSSDPKKRLRVVAADQLAHTHATEIRAALAKAGRNPSLEGTATTMLALPPEVLTESARNVTIGLEGYTERLRASVAKPISDDELVEIGVRAAQAGITHHSWCVIYGLPGERHGDHLEFCATMERYVKAVMAAGPRHSQLLVRFHPFTPQAQTPYQWAAAGYGYPRERLAAIEATAQRLRTPAMGIPLRPLWTSDGRVLWRMIQMRGNERCRELFLGASPDVCARSPRLVRRTFRSLVGFDPVDEISEGTELPWDRFVDYPRAKLLAIWRAAKRRAEA